MGSRFLLRSVSSLEVKTMKTSSNIHFRTISLWTISTGLAWILGNYMGFALQEPSGQAYSWADVTRITIQFALNGAVIGLLCSLFQSMLLKPWLRKSQRWFIATIIGYTLGFPVGYLLPTVLLWTLNPAELDLSAPLVLSMAGSGLFIAAIQWALVLAKLPGFRVRVGMLWALTSMVIWTLGIVLSSIVGVADWPLPVRQGIAGGLIGLLTLGLLRLLTTSSKGSPDMQRA